MQISGEVDITIDQYADFEIDLDVDRLAEELATDHNFVDDTVLHAYVEEYCDNRVSERVDEETEEMRVLHAHAQAEFEGELQDLRDQVSELEPNNSERDASTGLTPTEFTTLVQSIVREEIRAALDAAAKWYPSA